MKTTKFNDFKVSLLSDPEVKAVYDQLADEYEAVRAELKARAARRLIKSLPHCR